MKVRFAFLGAAALSLLVTAAPAAAYIGPGSGISLLGGLWAVLVGIVLALAAILFWPIRYMIKRRRARKNAGQPEPAEKPSEHSVQEPAQDPAISGGNGESSK
ncbi:MAG: hypothetical protein KGY48_10715 [Wenzhouxiangellaceae bacterium]|nr:hypothetical protein [Wenzhouxiangellaceae bacterium]MBS3747064.1 hypothetical protein [Wenzhouxiangellaceae bacterium]